MNPRRMTLGVTSFAAPLFVLPLPRKQDGASCCYGIGYNHLNSLHLLADHSRSAVPEIARSVARRGRYSPHLSRSTRLFRLCAPRDSTSPRLLHRWHPASRAVPLRGRAHAGTPCSGG